MRAVNPSWIFVGTLLAVSTGCVVGDQGETPATPDAAGGGGDGGGGGGADASNEPRVAASVTPSVATSELWTSGAVDPTGPSDPMPAAANRFVVTLTSEGGFAGDVTPAVTGLGTDWVATFDPPVVTLAAEGTSTTTLRLLIPSTAAAAPAGMPLTITATSSLGVETLPPVMMHVLNQITVDDQVQPFPTLTVTLGVQLRILNTGTANHIIHGANAVPHENIASGGHPPGQFYIPNLSVGDGIWGGHEFNGDPGDLNGQYVPITILPPPM
ncbi:MAG: hypothetical protein R2939_12200 [Kofleriaceae bacterium]